jgi:carboxyl-terminal processing protease
MRLPAAAAALVVTLVASPQGQAPQGVETFDAAWTIVRDTHFDKAFNGVDWEAIRTELRPRATAAKSATELRVVLREMLGRLGQSHFSILPASADASTVAGGIAEPGFDVRLAPEGVLVTSVEPDGSAAAAGVKTGWRVKAIGQASIDDLLRALPDGSENRLRRLEAWRAVELRLRGPAGSRVVVAFEDASDKRIELTLDRRAESGQPVTVGNLPTMLVRVDWRREQTPARAIAGIIRFNVWMAAVDAQFQKAIDELRTAAGIVVDLRGNPGGLALMMRGISGHFVADSVLLGVMKTRDSELRFAANPRLVNGAGERVSHYGGPVAILVDSLTGSASECFSGGMQSIKRARVFGQTSMGQALPALFDRLPNGDVMIHAYGDFVTADGTRLEGRGVIPDEIVPLRREDLLAGRDRTLEAALTWIDTLKADGKGVSEPQQP